MDAHENAREDGSGDSWGARWAPTRESDDFFIDEDRLRGWFLLIVAISAALLVLLGAGLWRLQGAALAPPTVIGIAGGRIFRARPGAADSIQGGDLDRQLSDTVEVLFGRTEKGLPPQIREYCAPEVISSVDSAYRDAAARFPAGYIQTLELAETRTVAARPGARRLYCRGILSSRSAASAQVSPVYLDCTFVAGAPTPLNASGWKLVQLSAIGRDDYYRDERERAVRDVLGLSPPHP